MDTTNDIPATGTGGDRPQSGGGVPRGRRRHSPARTLGQPLREEERLIFVSHAGEDTWVARQVARCIAETGARPFLDEADIEVGEEFEDNIRNFIDQAHELIVLMTPWSLGRPYVWAEIGAAWIRKIPIIVVLYGLTVSEFQSRSNAPVFLKKRDIININDIDQYISQLGKRVLPESRNDY